MPFCPKCWEEYPKDFIECNVCNEPLIDEKPDSSKTELPQGSTSSAGPMGPESSKAKKKRRLL